MTRKYKAGDKFILISTPHAYVDISTHTEYTLYETIDGRLVFRDDVDDERAFTESNGTLSDWMQPCDIRLVNDVEKPVMIDARKLLERISNDTTIREAIAYVQGVIDGQEDN